MSLAAVLLAAPVLPGQTVTGGIDGRVVDAAGEPVADVRVGVTGSTLQRERTARTREDGHFRVLDLPVGTYAVRFTRVGLRPVQYADVRVRLGAVTTLGIVHLEPEAVELPEVVVVARAPAIDPMTTTVGSGLDAPYYESLPIDRRDYQSIIRVLPHVNQSFAGDQVSIGGSTGLENAYFIDGANVTDPILGAGGTRLPWNFIRSLQVRSGGFQAEYGKALGGIVDAVTHSGSNDPEVSVFGFYSGSALAGTPRAGLADLRADAFYTADLGARVGGPIVRDLLWAVAAYNPRIESIDREIPGHGVFTDKETIHAFAGRVTWQPASATSVDLSVFGDPSTRDAVGQVIPSLTAPSRLDNPDPLLTRQLAGGSTISARLRQQLGPRVALDVDLAGYWASRHIRPGGPGAPLQLFVDLTDNSWSGGPGYTEESNSRRLAAAASATMLLGPHAAKIGIEYESNRLETAVHLDEVLRLDEDLYERNVQFTSAPHRNRIPTIYVQDSWQITPRLNMSAGLRWSRQELDGDDGAGVQPFPDQWQPRIGAVLQLGRLGSQRLFGSYGRYYQQLPIYFSTLFFAPFNLRFEWYSEDPRQGVAPDSSLNLSSDASDFPPVSGLRAEHFDEFTGGYERALGGDYVLAARALHRVLRAGFGYGVDDLRTNPVVIGNFGEGELDFLPKATREYSALEVTLRRAGAHRLQGFVSYVLSRTRGNYTGLYASDQGVAAPNNNPSNKFEEQGPNSTGLLPSDRTHVLKLSAAYRFDFGLTAGTFASVQSGTPLNDFGAGSQCPFCPVFLVPRGSAGRSPTLWDLSVSFTYALPIGSSSSGRAFLDVLHIGNPRRAAWLDQTRYLSQDGEGNQINPNPNFGQPLAYQPPMSARVGFEFRL